MWLGASGIRGQERTGVRTPRGDTSRILGDAEKPPWILCDRQPRVFPRFCMKVNPHAHMVVQQFV